MQHIFQAIILGLIQGVTEFIPISSSGHLVVTKYFLNWHELGGKTFDLALHFGTLFALIIYFWADIIKYAKAILPYNPSPLAGEGMSDEALAKSGREREQKDTDRKLVWLLLLSALPGFIFGGLFENYLEAKMGHPLMVAFNLAFFGVILYAADHYGKKERHLEEVNWKDALVIGLSQAIALAPGVSRSGITMTAGIFRKLTRETSARFSFLMLVPIILGAVMYKTLKVAMHHELSQIFSLTYLAGIMAAFVSGYVCIAFLLNYLRKRNFDVFVIYRIVLSLVIVIWYFRK